MRAYACVTAGMTNAGKTFTVLGSEDNPGLLTRAVSDCISAVKAANAKPRTSSGKVPDVFSSESDITEDMLAAATAGNGSTINQLPELLPGESLAVSLSCLEIYNDQVYDVLVPAPPEGGPPRTILKIKDGISGRYDAVTLFALIRCSYAITCSCVRLFSPIWIFVVESLIRGSF